MGDGAFLKERLKNLQEVDLSFDAVDHTLDRARAFSAAEPALVHPFYNSVVKMRNNGMIDVMVDGNNGIRIDPTTQSINFIGESVKFHTSSIRAWLSEGGSLYAQKGWQIQSGGTVTIQAPRLDLNVPVGQIAVQGRSLPSIIRSYNND